MKRAAAAAVPAEDVLSVLARACSQDSAVLKPAEQQLKQWETQPGFYHALVLIFANSSLDTTVRWLAVLYLKNGVDRYWRRTAPNALDDGEKGLIRQRLLDCAVGRVFESPPPQLATQLALVVGKVARVDCPVDWPELFPIFMDAIVSNCGPAATAAALHGTPAAAGPVLSPVQQQVLLAAFYQVVKCMASRRLSNSRKDFEKVVQATFSHVFAAWQAAQCSLDEHLAVATSSASAATELAPALLADLERSVLTFKVLRKLTVFGCKHPGQWPPTAAFLQAAVIRFEQLCDNEALAMAGGQLAAGRRKSLSLVGKLLLDMLEFHPTSFVPLLQPVLSIVYRYCFTDLGSRLIFESLAVDLLNVAREIVVSEEYKLPSSQLPSKAIARAERGTFGSGTGISSSGAESPSAPVEGTVHPAAPTASQLLAQFFVEPVVLEMGRRLVSDYFPMTAADLELWDSDPEHFVVEESGGDSLKFSLRPCAEALYLVLLKAHRSWLGPQLVSMLVECCRASAAADPSSAPSSSASAIAATAGDLGVQLRREAVYKAVGLACFDLYEQVNFDQLLVGALLGELHVRHAVYRLVRRRVVWLVGRLHGVRLSPSVQPALLDAVESALAAGEDLVVRLEAAATLRSLLDDFEFDADRFAPRVGRVLALLCALLADALAVDTRLLVLHAVSFVVERCGAHVRPHAADLLERCLVPLWQLAENAGTDERGMLRCAVAGALAHLVRCLTPALSGGAYALALPIVRLAVDPSDGAHVYLLDDGLELWEALLQSAPSPQTPATMSPVAAADAERHASLLELCAAVPRLVRELTSESLRACARIVEAYLALDGAAVVAAHGRALADCLTEAAHPGAGGGCDLKPEGQLIVLKLVELFFQLQPAAAYHLFAELMLLVVGALLAGITDNDDGYEEGSPSFTVAAALTDDDGLRKEETHPAILTAYCSLLARAALHDPRALLAYAGEYVRRRCCTGDSGGGSIEAITDRVVDRLLLRWIDCLDRMSQPEKRKLSALGLAELLRSPSRAASARLPDLIGACVQVLCDVCELRPDGCGGQCCVDTLVMQDGFGQRVEQRVDGDDNDDEDEEGRATSGAGGGSSSAGDNEHDRRKQRLVQSDPVFCLSLAEHVMRTLGAMEQWEGSGGSVAERLQADVDPSVLQQLQSFLSAPSAAALQS